MKKLLFLVLMGIFISCSTTRKSSSLLQEEQLLITRKYIGNFVDYCHTGPEIAGGKDLIWIKTTVYEYLMAGYQFMAKLVNFLSGTKFILNRYMPHLITMGNGCIRLKTIQQ